MGWRIDCFVSVLESWKQFDPTDQTTAQVKTEQAHHDKSFSVHFRKHCLSTRVRTLMGAMCKGSDTEKGNLCRHFHVHFREHSSERSHEPFHGSIRGSKLAFESSVLPSPTHICILVHMLLPWRFSELQPTQTSTAWFEQVKTAVIPSERVQIWACLFPYGWSCPGVRTFPH